MSEKMKETITVNDKEIKADYLFNDLVIELNNMRHCIFIAHGNKGVIEFDSRLNGAFITMQNILMTTYQGIYENQN